jgi:hypothetical protein
MRRRLSPGLAAAEPEQQRAGQQAVEQEGNDAGNNAGFVGGDQQGHVEPADGDDVHVERPNYACKCIDSAEAGMENPKAQTPTTTDTRLPMAQGSHNNDAFMGSAAQFMQAGQNMMQQFMDYLGKAGGSTRQRLFPLPIRRR